MDEIVNLNICGTVFKPTMATVQSIDGSKLSNLDKSVTVHYFDRDPSLFKHILNAHRSGIVHIPRDVCPMTFKNEMEFWNVPLHFVAPCCWRYLYEPESDISTLKTLIESDSQFNSSYKVDPIRTNLAKNVFKDVKTENNLTADRSSTSYRIWLFLEEPGSSLAAKLWCFFYIAVVIISVIVYLVWLEPSLRISKYLSSDEFDVMQNETIYDYLVMIYNEKLVLLGSSDPKLGLFTVDMFCMVFFTFETIVHFAFCPHKCKYFRHPYNLLKLVLCISMLISTVFEIRKDFVNENVEFYGRLYYVCKSFNVLRLLLVFRLYKLYNGLHIMLLSLTNSRRELLLLMFTFCVGVIVYGCLIFSAEIETDMFATTWISMWWSLITMTTVGYGDFYPTTLFGYIVGTVCAINGLIVLALPIAAIAGTFSDLYSRNQDFKAHKDAIRKTSEHFGGKRRSLTSMSLISESFTSDSTLLSSGRKETSKM
ncbi:hypothetical protein ACF0H5_015662 [Mactra antiquata]